MSAFDDYLQLLNNNPKMDTFINNVKTTIEDSLPPTDPSKMIDYAAGMNPIAGLAGNILAWHASPHKFSKFENKAIGTGEGVQAFGMGHYSGENANALDYQYRKQLLHRTAQNPLEQFIADPNHQTALDKLRNHVDNDVIASYPGYSGFTDAQKKFVKLKNYNDTLKFTFNNAQLAKNYPKNTWSGLTDMNREVYDLSKAYTASTIISPNKGYLYQLNLKPDKKDLLQYDTAIPRHGTDFLDKYVAGMNDLGLGQDAFTAIKSNLKGKDAYRNLTKVTGSDTETSRLLNDWGIPGHSFAGQGGKGLDNYVMYNPDDMQIIRRIKAGLDNPIESFRNYPKDVHRAVNDFKLNSADAQPRTLLQKLKELSNKNLRDIEW